MLKHQAAVWSFSLLAAVVVCQESCPDLQRQIEDLRRENAELKMRLRRCNGTDTCSRDGRIYTVRERWRDPGDDCTTCTCLQNGEVECIKNSQCSERCEDNPCYNGGTCSQANGVIVCICPPSCTGQRCEIRSTHLCRDLGLPWSDEGSTSCDNTQEIVWQFDSHGKCRSACRAKGSHLGFATHSECDQACSVGSCCSRQQRSPTSLYGYSPQGYDRYGFDTEGLNAKLQLATVNTSTGFGAQRFRFNGVDFKGYRSDGINVNRYYRSGYDCQGVNSAGMDMDELVAGFNYSCITTTRESCHLSTNPYTQVVSFIESVSEEEECSECKPQYCNGCPHNGRVYRYEESFSDGCNTCVCTRSSRLQCTCTKISERQEIRDVKPAKLKVYRDAIRQLFKSGEWTGNSEMYAKQFPYHHQSSNFLAWNRLFLKRIERSLQKLASCDLAIEYFDWTMDAGQPTRSDVWRSGLFAGDGRGVGFCVEITPADSSDRSNPWSEDVGWSPCLSRRFNASMVLPTAADVEKALRSETVTQLSETLVQFSLMFRLFVGGHSTTSYAAYDPIYISHLAFIDKLWHQWQLRSNNYLKLDVASRYVPLVPFEATADDVNSSPDQVCVQYLEPGTRCAADGSRLVSGVEYKYDSYLDTLIYDVQGFDNFGFDRLGFYKDGFNTDGFDGQGYNQDGYDRYGYNRSGVNPQGERRDDSTSSEIKSPGVLTQGLDIYGRDIYGYDLQGTDRNGCTAYFDSGYNYVKQKFELQIELEKLNDEQLSKVARCADLDELPKWLFTISWTVITQSNKITTTNRHVARPHSNDGADVWPQNNIDSRFCVQTNIFSACRVGQSVTSDSCDASLCNRATCAAYHGEALCQVIGCDGECRVEWYLDGQVVSDQCLECYDSTTRRRYDEGERWSSRDGCRTCQCASSTIACQTICSPGLDCTHQNRTYRNGERFRVDTTPCQTVCLCQEGSVTCETESCGLSQCSHPVSVPGICCPQCRACSYEGSHYTDGETFSPDGCKLCVCESGSVSCAPQVCPPADCDNPYIPQGKCCPSCDGGCEYSGKYYTDGEIFTPSFNPCMNCSCKDSKVRCGRVSCPNVASLKCSRPVALPGDCCPSFCPDCSFDGAAYSHNDRFSPVSKPCDSCLCYNGFVSCRAKQRCDHYCTYGIILPGECCSQCTDCIVDGMLHTEGSRFLTRTAQGCSSCSCQSGEMRCSATEACQNLDCNNPFQSDDECCPKCPSCADGHEHGERWRNRDEPCEICTCQNEVVECQPTPCQPLAQCLSIVTTPGSCCPSCQDCILNSGQRRADNSRFNSPTDPCSICQCEAGTVGCSRKPCPSLNCSSDLSYIPQGRCCPVCQDLTCDYQGRFVSHGVQFKQGCSTCQCYRGNVTCRRDTCPPLFCSHPAKGACCPKCDECLYERIERVNGDRFQPADDPCELCVCSNGTVSCQTVSCPSECDYGIEREGQCCEDCQTGCMLNGTVYNNGDALPIKGVDECSECRCQRGHAECRPISCPNADCEYPTQGRCCQSCQSGCLIENYLHSEGDVIVEGCQQCTCKLGNLDCVPLTCPEINCEHPAQGECCPSCENGCLVESILYSNGETLVKDNCTRCTCLLGEMANCEPIVCPAISCSYPVQQACCPSCDYGCDILGSVYTPGQRVASQDACVECICADGDMECVPVTCPEIDCEHPTQGKCCPSCENGCLVESILYSNGETLVRDNCTRCTCLLGEIVNCEPVVCPAVSCSYPVQQACCPSCDYGCNILGSVYAPGQRVASQDACVECICAYGDMECVPVTCPEIDCEHPTQGKCCSSCENGCLVESILYSNGETLVRDDCTRCTCTLGKLANCEPVVCPAVSCLYPVQQACCPSCDYGCDILGSVYAPGQRVASQDACSECICADGDMDCVPLTCPEINCEHPTQGECCPSCENGCLVESILYSNGEILVRDDCTRCTCILGEIANCEPVVCPAVSCLYPVQQACCPSCDYGCDILGSVYAPGQRVVSQDACVECICADGDMECVPVTCPEIDCEHPTQRECCPSCENGCLVESILYSNGETVVKDDCTRCTCNLGEIANCEPVVCPAVSCSYPVQQACCPSCDYGCDILGSVYAPGQRIASQDACVECICADGDMDCVAVTCPEIDCEHPTQDECCPSCENGCLVESILYSNGEKLVRDDCTRCTCNLGEIANCEPVVCPAVSCSYPVQQACCPSCNYGCDILGSVYAPGQRVASQDACVECICAYGDMECSPVVCPEVACADSVMVGCCPTCDLESACKVVTCPSVDCLHPVKQACCLVCNAGCEDDTGFYYQNEILADRCISPGQPQSCICQNGTVECSPKRCPTMLAGCPEQLHDDAVCCYRCDSCRRTDRAPSDPDIWILDTETYTDFETCSTCQCFNGMLDCVPLACLSSNDLPCVNPAMTDTCCFTCDSCLYRGSTYGNGEVFADPDDLSCSECFCSNGTVSCSRLPCLRAPGSCELVQSMDQCGCETCSYCEVSGTNYTENQSWTDEDGCACKCELGAVSCDSCSVELTCHFTEPTESKTCCNEQCRSCMWKGQRYENGATWSGDNCTMVCSCNSGVIICTDMVAQERCVNSKCGSQLIDPSDPKWNVESECCVDEAPVCEGECGESEGSVFRNEFTSDCTVCTCTGGVTVCMKPVCLPLNNCPQDRIRLPDPTSDKSCCPVCLDSFPLVCSVADEGLKLPSATDACLECVCTDGTLICNRQICPPLVNCPFSERLTKPGECCPTCAGCYSDILSQPHGSTWQSVSDPCDVCRCTYGTVNCERTVECPPLFCTAGRQPFTPQGQCCQICGDPIEGDVCLDSRGRARLHGSGWLVDDCTICECLFGQLNCTSETCEETKCLSDQTLQLDEGQCCPHCVNQPAVCKIYGDPHYKTFDGHTIHYQGFCSYVAVKDCVLDRFQVIAIHDDRQTNSVSWIKGLIVKTERITLKLGQGMWVEVNGQNVSLPFVHETGLTARLLQPTQLLIDAPNQGFSVSWDGAAYCEITADTELKGKVCGLCGNFNDSKQDELVMENGVTAGSDAQYGDSWLVPGSECTGSPLDVHPCDIAGYEVKKEAVEHCSIIQSDLFSRCHRAVPPTDYLESCVYDMCACNASASCLCDSLTAYSAACLNSNVRINWRTNELCAMNCDTTKGFLFDECGPACPRTCDNYNEKLGEIESDCLRPCEPSCQCPAGLVQHRGRCVTPDLCD